MPTIAETRTSDYVCYATWSGDDTTNTVPLPECGDIYDPLTGTWTYPPPLVPA